MSDCLSGICIDEDGAISDLGRCEGFTRIHAGIDGVWVFRHHAPERSLEPVIDALKVWGEGFTAGLDAAK